MRCRERTTVSQIVVPVLPLNDLPPPLQDVRVIGNRPFSRQHTFYFTRADSFPIDFPSFSVGEGDGDGEGRGWGKGLTLLTTVAKYHKFVFFSHRVTWIVFYFARFNFGCPRLYTQ